MTEEKLDPIVKEALEQANDFFNRVEEEAEIRDFGKFMCTKAELAEAMNVLAEELGEIFLRMQSEEIQMKLLNIYFIGKQNGRS
jgi:hypothetical protein